MKTKPLTMNQSVRENLNWFLGVTEIHISRRNKKALTLGIRKWTSLSTRKN